MKATARFFGGPLDGQRITPMGARWSIYRDDTGAPIVANAGDQEWDDPTRSPQCHYVRQPDPVYADAKNPERHVIYVHATLWRAWEAQRYLGPNTTGGQ